MRSRMRQVATGRTLKNHAKKSWKNIHTKYWTRIGPRVIIRMFTCAVYRVHALKPVYAPPTSAVRTARNETAYRSTPSRSATYYKDARTNEKPTRFNLKLQWPKLIGAMSFGLVAALSSVTQAATPFAGITSSSKFVVYYGNDFSTATMNLLKTFNVVVLGDPANELNLTPARSRR